MDSEYTLAQQAFLLCYNPDKQRMARTGHLDHLVRAATLVELYQGAQLVDDKGKAAPARGASVADPVLASVLDEVGQTPGKSWKYWLRRNTKQTMRAVRAALADRRAVTVRQGRVLGVFPHTSVTVRDTRAVKQVRARVKDALRQPRPEPGGAALVALAAAVELGFVLDRKTRRQHKARITQCMDAAGPAAVALRELVQQRRAAAISGATAGVGAGS